ncbi:MAG: DNA polymerase III subunit delta [Bacteroides sp.]|nr:DNA polymerase III subunit delta [Bacteroides sp.]
MATPGFREILTSIKKGDSLSPVYVLMGEEAFYIDKLTEAFENYLIPEDDRDFNQSVFYGNDADLELVVSTAQQYPVMSNRKLVILKEAQSLYQAKTQLEKLAPYVSHPNKTTVFVIAFKGDKLNATSKLLKAASGTHAVVFKSEPVKEYQLPTHVKDYCAGLGYSIEEKAVSMLCDYIGTPLSKIFGEINKLIMIKGSEKKLTATDVEKNIGISKDYNNFELVKSVAIKNYPQTMKIIRYFEKNPKTNPTIVTNSMLFSFFQKISICHYLPDKTEKTLLEGLGLKSSWQLRDINDGLRNYNAMQAVNAIHYCREFDVKSKGVGSYQNEYDLFRELIFKIFTN